MATLKTKAGRAVAMQVEKQTFGGATVGIPRNWLDNSIVNFTGPRSGSVQPNLVLMQQVLPGSPTLQRYAAKQKEGLQQAGLEQLTFISEGPHAVDDRKFFRLSYTWVTPVGDEQHVVRQDQYYLLLGHRALTLTLTGPAGNFDELETLFSEIIENTTLI